MMDVPAWLNFGALGLTLFLLAVGIPWLLKHLREKDEAHQKNMEANNAAHQINVDKINAEHTARVNALIQDNKDERAANISALDKVCLAFKGASESEVDLCEKRINDLKDIYNRQFTELRGDIQKLKEKA